MSEWENSRCKRCHEFAGSILGYCSVCAREEGVTAPTVHPSVPNPTVGFGQGEFVRLVPSGKLAIFGEVRPNNQALIRILDTTNVVCPNHLTGRPLISWLCAGDRPEKCDSTCDCIWSIGHARWSDLMKVGESEARGEITAAWALLDERREAYWSDSTAASCPFKDCSNCGHRYCGGEDCQDGSTPSGGSWSIKCTSVERCLHYCRFCDHVRSVGNPCYGGTAVCCSCRVPRGPW